MKKGSVAVTYNKRFGEIVFRFFTFILFDSRLVEFSPGSCLTKVMKYLFCLKIKLAMMMAKVVLIISNLQTLNHSNE